MSVTGGGGPDREGPGVGSPFLWRVLGLGTGAGGAYILATGRGSLSLGILLCIVALAASSVLLGSGRSGPDEEGALDLSARLGLGLLGGLLGTLAAALVRSALLALDLPRSLGVTLEAFRGSADLLAHYGSGALWGMVLGVLYHGVPASSGAGRGVLFSLVPSLYLLLKVYPVDRGLGLFGVELGGLLFLFVLLLNAAWGLVAGATVGWGERSDEAPVARAIDA